MTYRYRITYLKYNFHVKILHFMTAKSDQDMDPELTPMRIHNAGFFPTFLPTYFQFTTCPVGDKCVWIFRDVFMSFSSSDFEPRKGNKVHRRQSLIVSSLYFRGHAM
jgi:hypothetical protein